MRSKVTSFFNDTFESFTSDLTDEQIGKLMRLVVNHSKGNPAPFISDRQLFIAYRAISGNADYILHTGGRNYREMQNKLTEARINAN